MHAFFPRIRPPIGPLLRFLNTPSRHSRYCPSSLRSSHRHTPPPTMSASPLLRVSPLQLYVTDIPLTLPCAPGHHHRAYNTADLQPCPYMHASGSPVASPVGSAPRCTTALPRWQLFLRTPAQGAPPGVDVTASPLYCNARCASPPTTKWDKGDETERERERSKGRAIWPPARLLCLHMPAVPAYACCAPP